MIEWKRRRAEAPRRAVNRNPGRARHWNAKAKCRWPLPLCSVFVLQSGMSRVARPEALTAAILAAPAWAHLGLAVRDPRMRERAAQEVAETVLDRLENEFSPEPHPDQLALVL